MSERDRKNYTMDITVRLSSYLINADSEAEASILAYEDLRNHIKGNSNELEFDYEIIEIDE